MLPILLCALTAGCERRTLSQRDTTPVLVEINGKSFTKRDFDLFLPEDYQHILTMEEKHEYFDRWVVTQLLYDEVVKSGAGITPEIEARLEQYKKDLVADQLVQRVIEEQATVSEREVRAYYNEHAAEYLTEYRVSHILVNSYEDAEKVKGLVGQRSFTYLARRYSIDKHSGAGGDLGYLSKGNMIPEFENVVFGMQVGEVSDIIESEFGYHIIRIEDIRDARVRLEFEDVREEIASILMLRKRAAVYDNLVSELKDRADIRITDAAMALTGGAEPDTMSYRRP